MNNIRTKNEVFYKALGLLSHPITVLSISILLINDWFLRIYWPSWLTGKIGDFAWMFFFPFVIASIVALIIPASIKNQERFVKISAFLLAGLIFILPKIFSTANSALNNLLEVVIGLPTDIRRDPTDLLALISLGLAWLFWDRDIKWKKSNLIPGLVSFQMAVFLTIANAPAQDYGIDALEIDQGQVLAYSAYFKFSSEDGGMTWQQDEFTYSENSHKEEGSSGTIAFDYTPGEIIKVSKDGGASFPIEYSLIPANQPLQLKYEQRSGSPVFRHGPLDAVIDPVTGNIIFAMGHEGILVYTTSDTWEWVAVDKYQRLSYDPQKELAPLILGEIFLALGFGFLVINTFTITIHKRVFRKVLLVLGWGVLLTNLVLLPPGIFTNNQLQPYHAILPIIFYIIQSLGVILFLILGIMDLIKIFSSSKVVFRQIILIGLLEIAIFITPYILWGFNILPKYSTAAILAPSLGALVLIGGYLMMYKSIDSMSIEIQEP